MNNLKTFVLAFMLFGWLGTSTSIAQDIAVATLKTKERVTKTLKTPVTIAEFIATSKEHTTLSKALEFAELIEPLSSKDTFTVFAPTDAAFDKLPKGVLKKLLIPSGKTTLQEVLKFHVVAGAYTAADLVKLIKKSGGEANLETVGGSELAVILKDNNIYIKDASGNIAQVTTADVKQSNGVIHVVDNVVLPN